MRQDQFDAKHDNEIEQITEEDVRFYLDRKVTQYVPSATTILDELKNPFLDILKDKIGVEAMKKLLVEGATAGTKVHNAIEEISRNILMYGTTEYYWIDDFGTKKLTSYEWQMVLKFVEFYQSHVKRILYVEERLADYDLFVGGTIDMIVELKDGRIALVDHKTSNALSDYYSVQTMIYKMLVEKELGINIDVRGVLWLKSAKRGIDKKGKVLQGAGWEYAEHSDDERDLMLFNCAMSVFKDRYRKGTILPQIKTYPTKVII